MIPSSTPSIRNSDDFIGDRMSAHKPSNTTRLYFANVNGLSYGPQGGDFADVCSTMATSHIDLLGLVETKLDSRLPQVVATCKRAARAVFSFSRVVLSSSAISYGTPYKPGGTALLAAGNITGRITHTHQDHMGRWSAISFLGAQTCKLTVICAYQVCKAPSRNDRTHPNPSTKLLASITQQQAMINMLEPGSSMHPRAKFRGDLLAFIKELQQDGHEVILIGDFNEAFGSDPAGLSYIASQCSLFDVLDQKIGTSSFGTYATGTDRIDYALMSSIPAGAVTKCGFESPGYRLQGDHRGFFVDFITDRLFGNVTPALASPASRHISSNDRANCARFVAAKYKYLQEHNWFQRMQLLDPNNPESPANPEVAEALDNDWLRASKFAENQCSFRPAVPYSTPLAKARQRRRAIKLLITAYKRRQPLQPVYSHVSTKTSDPLPQTLQECEIEQRRINKEIKSMEKNAGKLRRQEQLANIELRLKQGDRAGARAIRHIMAAEEAKEMWKQIQALNPTQDSGITTVEVPSDGNLSTSNCKSCESWNLLTDPVEIRQALICRNRLHFGQAHGTFPTIPPFSENIDWAASTPVSDDILEGLPAFDNQPDAPSSLFLQQFKITTALNSIPSAITLQEWTGKMNVWRETTTTSPSGMHLGHHKALLTDLSLEVDSTQPGQPSLDDKRKSLLQGQLDLLNYAIHHNYTYKRWHQVATFMIRKDPDSSKIHRLRVIHLYEADLNLLLGVKWRSLVHHCIDNSLLNQGQFGGLPGKDAMTPILLEELQWETSRASRRTLLRMDFDAASCYDRIIPSIASLAARSFGQHSSLCIIHASFLQQAKYLLKTKLGLSEEDYSHCQLHPIYGTGQGSANSPVIWALISSRLFDAHAVQAHGATFLSPDRTFHIQIFMIGFVDDTNACVNDFENPDQSPANIIHKATSDAQLWNDLLRSSGGALEISKCIFHLAHYGFTATGAPVLKSPPSNVAKVTISESESTSPIQLTALSPYTARKTLGCYKSPSSNYKTSLQHITTKALRHSTAVQKSFISAKCAHRYYGSVFFPSVTYSFPTNAIPERHLQQIQNKSTRPILNKMGYAKSFPHALIYGPPSLGGIGLRTFYDEQGSTKMELVLKHLRCPTMVNTQLHIALAWCQRMCGTSTPILEFPTIELPHLETTFFPSLREYLKSTDAALVLETTHITPLQRIGDFHLMDSVLQSNHFTPRQIRLINYCRLFLQVHTIADLATAGGTHIDQCFIHGKPSLLSSTSTDLEIHQDRPATIEAWKVWKSACKLWCNLVTGELHRPLGQWKFPGVSLRRSWPYYWDPPTNRLIVRTADGYTAHRPFKRGPRGMRFKRYPSTAIPTLPSTCFPTEALEYRIGFTQLPSLSHVAPLFHSKHHLPTLPPQHFNPPPPSDNIYAPTTQNYPNECNASTHCTNISISPPQLSDSAPHHTVPIFEEFLLGQSEYTRQLLHTLSHHLPFSEICPLLLDPTSNPTAVCDGSVVLSQGTFGWVLATSTPPRILVRCSGPAYGSCMDSFRAEAYGLLSVTTFLHLLTTYLQQPSLTIDVWCDNLAVVNTINRLTKQQRPDFPNDTLRPSWDVLQAIQQNFRHLPSITLSHVKGHQDTTNSPNELPFPARLNIAADKLATSFQQLSSHADDLGPIIPGTRCHLALDQKFIPSHHRKKLRLRRGHKYILQYIQQRHNISDAAFMQIDWESYKSAINKFRQKHTTFITKFLSKWLPVGKQVHRYNPALYSSRCPSCECPVEDFNHAFRCPERRQWQSLLRQDLLRFLHHTNTNPILIDLLINGLNHWLRNTEAPPTSPSSRYNSLVESQTDIGWDQLIFGRWSSLWTTHQDTYLQRQHYALTPKNHGTGWTTKIITIIWSHCYDEWITRNQALHGFDQQTRQRARVEQAQYKIRALYKLKSKCTRYVQAAWFHPSPEDHFKDSLQPSQLEHWLAINEARIISHVAHQQRNANHGQRAITDFYSRTASENEANRAAITTTTTTVSLTNAPLTSEPGGSAGDELRAHR
jgi:hypothetical protein